MNNSVAIATSCSREGRYIEEWVAHYSLLGVSRFFIFEHNNEEDEDTPAVKARLEATGKVTFLQAVKTGVTQDIQMDNFNVALDLALQENIGWLFCCDLDEYLVFRRHESLQELVDGFPDRVDQVTFSWMIYGSSGELTYDPDKLHFEKFKKCAGFNCPVNRAGKSMVRVANAIKMDLHHHQVKGVSIGGDLKPYRQLKRHEQLHPEHGIGFLAHFAVRSLEEFNLKSQRGYASSWHPPKPGDSYWERRDLNFEDGPDLSKQSANLRARLTEWESGTYPMDSVPNAIEWGRRIKASLPALMPGVPRLIPNWRAKAVLEALGLLSSVEAAINAIPGTEGVVVRNAWNSGADLDRIGPTVVSMAAILQLSEDDLDDIFIQANKIVV